ncbi:helix-turn-helix transcriptional regulator [Paenibacillus filicis]|uniref:Helix-turn-helix transcriptional regulator n=1 Tax=Paenibacillus gyeongsangnamensis TaxID=3388067 RepID=A0ABT4QDL9_9BACL|nr:helix-turn-helix transcriptional regulator [Paenibacillus filicis]MCZ8514973.1 helix-turn-helix transcriptional regulator [Paenibacillus filicis]
MSKLSDHVGSRIRIFRKKRGLTQAQLSEKVQQPQSYISDIERGEKNISLDTLERIVEALEIHPGELFNSYNGMQSNEQLKKDRQIDLLTFMLKDRDLREISTITRLIEDVLKAYDTK